MDSVIAPFNRTMFTFFWLQYSNDTKANNNVSVVYCNRILSLLFCKTVLQLSLLQQNTNMFLPFYGNAISGQLRGGMFLAKNLWPDFINNWPKGTPRKDD